MSSPKLKNSTSMTTRSASSASAKTTSTNNNQPLSTDSVLTAIADLRKTQELLIKNNNALGDELKSRLDVLTSRFDSLSTEIKNIREKVASLDARVLSLESHSSITNLSSPVNEVIQEFSERERCKSNIIAYGIPESTSSNLASKFADDQQTIHSLISKLSIVATANPKVVRLGKFSTSTPRPIKCIFNSPNLAADILSSLRTTNLISLGFPPKAKFVRDKTPLERKLLRTCHEELNSRTLNGETDLTITYLNGVPRVVSRSKNFNTARSRKQN